MRQKMVRLGGLIAVLTLLATLWRLPQPQAAAARLQFDSDVRDDASVFARINGGGYAGQHLKYGYFWSADQAFSGGKTSANLAVGIAGTDDDELYQRARVSTADLGSFSYAIALPLNTAYTVRLHFAETYWGATNGGPGGAGRRVFSANFEGGSAELANYDINAAVGPMTAVIKEFSVPVSDGVLNIDFSASVNRPLVAAIEVLLYNAPAPYRPGITSAVWINADTDQLLDVPEYEDETDGLKAINLSTLPTRNLNIQATPSQDVGSIKFIYAGQVYIENTAPYATFGNQGADYLPWTPMPGDHELTVIAYTEPNGQGVAGPTGRLYFQVSDQPIGPTMTATSSTDVPSTPTSTSVSATPIPLPSSTPTATSTPTFPATATRTPTPTAQVGSPPATPTTGFTTINIVEELQWYRRGVPASGAYDIVVVHDMSQSMGYCWYSNEPCPIGQRRIDHSSFVMPMIVNEFLINRPATFGVTNRVAYITYGPEVNGATASLRIPLSGSSPQAFEALVGVQNNPRTIPAAEISGYTNTAAALKLADQELGNARQVDQNGFPVKLAVIVITDGTADVLFDGPYAGQPNRYDAAPFYCGQTIADLNNPLVQSSCPRGAGFGEPSSPIRAAIDVANTMRSKQADREFKIYTIVPGNVGDNSIEDFNIHLMTDYVFRPETYFDIDNMFNTFEVYLAQPCQEYRDTPRPAAGANVTLHSYDGSVVYQGYLTADGSQKFQLPPGPYILTAAHTNVVSPKDPLALPRNYTRLQPMSSALPASSLIFEVPNTTSTRINAKLLIDNPANARCP